MFVSFSLFSSLLLDDYMKDKLLKVKR